MRHITVTGTPPSDWLKRAEDVLNRLRKAEDHRARNAIIKKEQALWGELKDWLLGFSHDKCWYSEAKDCASHWEIEHYRPKNPAKNEDGTRHGGYWWLAFDWRNYRVSGSVVNRKKLNFFPLRPGCQHVGPDGDLGYEDPVLLDPADPDDPNLLSFNMAGEAVPAPHLTCDWERTRVKYSVKRYALDSARLETRRQVVWTNCWSLTRTYLAELQRSQKEPSNILARNRLKAAMKDLRALVKDDVELSSVARACLLNSGDERLRSVLKG